MKRSLSARRLAVVLGLAVIVAGFTPPLMAAAEPGTDVRGRLATAPVYTEVVAAAGTKILAYEDDSLALSMDNGQTWGPAAFDWDENSYLDSVVFSKAVFVDYLNSIVNVFDMFANESTWFVVPSGAGEIWAANAETAVTAIEDDGFYYYNAVDLRSGDVTELSDDWFDDWPSGWDSNDFSEVWAWAGEQGAAVQTNYIYDGVQVASDIDPLPLDGDFGADVVRVRGYVPYVGIVGDRVEWVQRVNAAVSVCSVLIADYAATPSCSLVATLSKAGQSVLADRSGSVLRLELNGVEYIWEANALTKVSFTGSSASWEGNGDAARPLIHVMNGTAGAVFQVLADGTTERLFDDFGVPIRPYTLDLAADRIAGSDKRASAWTRPLAETIGAETTLGSRTHDVSLTAGRTVVGGETGLTFYDRGTKKSTFATTGSLADASGPYALVNTAGKGSIRTSSGAVTATNPVAIFGSRTVTKVDAQTAKVLDVASPQDAGRTITLTSGMGTWAPFQTRMWGDWISFDLEQSGGTTSNTEIYNLADPDAPWSGMYYDGSLVALGDGVAVVYDRLSDKLVLWNIITDDRAEIEGDVAALDDANHLVLADDDELIVRAIPGAGTSAPRLLGTVAPASFNPNAGAWLPEFDTTKALAEGTLEVSHGTGDDRVVDRVLSVPASADGSIRGVAWDGKDDVGTWVPDGPYTWTLKLADAADPAKELVAIDGTSAASGTVTVKAANLGTATGPTPKVSDTTPTVDQTLTVTTGTWTPATVQLAYQWYRGSTAIPAATASTYVVQPADAGLALKVKVTGSCPGTESWCRGYASATKSSAATSTVKKATITPAPAPTLDVTAPVVDGTVTATVAAWGPDPVVRTYQWYKVNSKGTSSAISGAKAEAFTPTGTEVGYRLKLKVTGTKPGYTTKSVYSALTGKVVKAVFTSVPEPTVTGSVKVGMPLTAQPGTADPTAKPAYQWYRGTSAITGAKSATYTTTSSDLAKVLKVRVTYARSGYTSVVRYSAVTAPIEPGLVAATPKLDDTTPAVGQVLHITDATGIGAWTPGVTPAYQWYRDSSAIPGATEASYEVQAADVGKAIKVKVSGSLDGYVTVTKTSSASSDVAKGTFTTKPAPTIEGTAQVGQTLTAVPGEWAPAPTSFGYVWYRSGSVISGQTGATYTLVAADAGKAITVKVTAIRSGFTSASATSAATGPILA